MHIPPLDLNLLATLALLLKTRSVTATARKLGLSQPTISRSLAQLRSIVGDPLLVRVGNRMARTVRAEELVEPVNAWLASASSLLTQPIFDPACLNRRFRVASSDFGVLAVIGPALPSIFAAAPGVSVDVVPLPFEPASDLASGEIDIAVSGLDYDPSLLHSRALFTDRFACLLRRNHPLATNGDAPLALDAFLDFPHLGITVSDAEFDRITQMLDLIAVRRNVVATLPFFYAAPDVLVGSEMVMTIPMRAAERFSARYGLALRTAPVELGTLDYWLLWHERSAQDPAIVWLSDMLAAGAGHSPCE